MGKLPVKFGAWIFYATLLSEDWQSFKKIGHLHLTKVSQKFSLKWWVFTNVTRPTGRQFWRVVHLFKSVTCHMAWRVGCISTVIPTWFPQPKVEGSCQWMQNWHHKTQRIRIKGEPESWSVTQCSGCLTKFSNTYITSVCKSGLRTGKRPELDQTAVLVFDI